MHLYPLWSGAFQHRLERFVGDLPPSQTDDERLDHMSDQCGSEVTLQWREAWTFTWPSACISSSQLSFSTCRGKWMTENYRNLSPGRRTPSRRRKSGRTAKYSDPSSPATKLLKSVTLRGRFVTNCNDELPLFCGRRTVWFVAQWLGSADAPFTCVPQHKFLHTSSYRTPLLQHWQLPVCCGSRHRVVNGHH